MAQIQSHARVIVNPPMCACPSASAIVCPVASTNMEVLAQVAEDSLSCYSDSDTENPTPAPMFFTGGKSPCPQERGKKGGAFFQPSIGRGKKSYGKSAMPHLTLDSEDCGGSDSSGSDTCLSDIEEDEPSIKTVLAGPSAGKQQQRVIVAADIIAKKKTVTIRGGKAPAVGVTRVSVSTPVSPKTSTAAKGGKPDATKKPQGAFATAVKPKSKPAPHLRRLRVADIKRQPSKAQLKRQAAAGAEGAPPAKKAKAGAPTATGTGASTAKKSVQKGGVPEPDEIVAADTKSLETHPVILYLRRHTPVKPCGRCAECRRTPCGKCGSCKKNTHLTERSRARERCTANGCTKLTEEELDRYRRAFNSAYTVNVLEKELRMIRTEFMAIHERSSKDPKNTKTSSDIQALQAKQANLISRLQALNDEDPVIIQQTPEGYECFMLSIQTLETERDRIARLIERRTCRDPPRIMSSRRQLRDFYGLKISNLTRLFATEMVARPYVARLIEIADEQEKLINSFPQTETEGDAESSSGSESEMDAA